MRIVPLLSGFWRIFFSKSFRLRDKLTWLYFNAAISLEGVLPGSRHLNILPSDYSGKQPDRSIQSDLPLRKNLAVEIVNTESNFAKSGILTQMCKSLNESCNMHGVRSEITSIPSGKAALYHQIFFRGALPLKDGTSTMLVTHVDSLMKLRMIQWQVGRGLIPLCISEETMNIVQGSMISAKTPVYSIPIPPQRSDSFRKVKIGFFSRIYRDGRKRESDLIMALQKLDPDWIEFFVMGEETSALVESIQSRGFSCQMSEVFDLPLYREWLSTIDYVVYTGHDEVAISVLDAIRAGVKAYAPAVGLNLELNPISLVLFSSPDDLGDRLYELVAERKNIAKSLPIAGYDDYCERHIAIWNYCSPDYH